MTTLRAAVLEQTLADFRNRSEAPENSIICRYFRREHEESFRIKVKRLWESGDVAETTRFVAAALMREGRFQKLHVHDSILPLITWGKTLAEDGEDHAFGAPSNDAARRRRAGKAARAALRAVANARDESVCRGISVDELRQAVEAMLDASPHGHACATLMEYRIDMRMGDKALGSRSDREKTESIVRTKTNARGLDPESESYRNQENRLLVAEAREWLVNSGCSLRDGRIDGIARVKDVPVGLVELCQREKEGRLSAGPKTDDSLARDALALYRSLNEEGAKRRYCIVPIEQDPACGAGLYLLGTGLFDEEFTAWLYPDIERRRIRLARSRRKASDNHVSIRATALETRKLGLDERRLALIKSNACVVAMVSHAQVVESLKKSHVFDSGPFGLGADGRFPSEQRLIQGLFHDEVIVWPAPIATVAAMEQVIAHFRRALCVQADTGKSGLAAYRAANEDAPQACPERFLTYFYEDDF